MSSVVVAGDTSGSVTLQAPAVAGTTVLTLPATTGTVALTGQAGMTLLANSNITATSSFVISGLTLTNYKQIQIIINGATTGTAFTLSVNTVTLNIASKGVIQISTTSSYGVINIDLLTGVAFLGGYFAAANELGNALSFGSNITTATTSLTFAGGTFNAAGNIVVYGVA